MKTFGTGCVKETTYPVVPDTSIALITELFTVDGLQTGDADQNIDGSVTPITYYWELDTGLHGDTVLIRRVHILIVGDNISDLFDYGNRGVLANGLIIQATRNAVTRIYATIKTNIDFAQISTESKADSHQVSGNTFQNVLELDIVLDTPVIATAGFKYEIIVQDDLTTLSYQRASVFFETL